MTSLAVDARHPTQPVAVPPWKGQTFNAAKHGGDSLKGAVINF